MFLLFVIRLRTSPLKRRNRKRSPNLGRVSSRSSRRNQKLRTLLHQRWLKDYYMWYPFALLGSLCHQSYQRKSRILGCNLSHMVLQSVRPGFCSGSINIQSMCNLAIQQSDPVAKGGKVPPPRASICRPLWSSRTFSILRRLFLLALFLPPPADFCRP